VDAHTVKLYWRAQLIKMRSVSRRAPKHGPRRPVPEVSAYAGQDLNMLQRKPAHGNHVGKHAAACCFVGSLEGCTGS